jgi:hypothetical protein
MPDPATDPAVDPIDPAVDPIVDPANPVDPAVDPVKAAMPEWADKRFWDEEKGELRVEDIHKSWKSAQDLISGKSPSPDAYELNFGEDVPEEMLEGLTADNDYVKSMMEIAKDSKMSQENFDKFIGLQVIDELGKIEAVKAEREVQVKALGEHGARRIKDAQLWLDASLPDTLSSELKGLLTTSASVEAIEGLIKASRGVILPAEPLTGEIVDIHSDLRKRQFAKDDNGVRLMQNADYANKWRDDAAAANFQG